VGIKDIPLPRFLLNFGPKAWKSLVTSTYPKNLYCPKRHFGPFGVKFEVLFGSMEKQSITL